MALTRDQILEANDLKTEEVQVAEWGGSVFVRTMTGTDRDSFEDSLVTTLPDGSRRANIGNMRAKLVAMTIVDEAGNRLFDASDIDRLALKSAAALKRVYDAAQRLNGIGQEAEEAAVKNSEAAQSGASTSD
jgi:hypothetical protein